MPEEKRRFSRIDFWGGGQLVIEGKTYTIDQIDDLSVGGCHFELDNNFVKGTACTVKMFLAEGQQTVTVEAEVSRTDDRVVALSFTSIKPEDLAHLKNIVRYNAPDPDRIEEEIGRYPGIK